MEHQVRDKRSNQPYKTVLFVLFAVAFCVRLSGLSHDLHFNMLYHPDTSKQVRAVEQFLSGEYLNVQGHSDYDGYPFFNSHLVEYLVRVVMLLETGWLKLTGAWTGPVDPPTFISLFWIMRAWNAFLSALAVPIVFVLGLRFNRLVAWLSGLMLLVSPLDVSACHFASNDSAAAFFSVLALFFGFRISEEGRWRDLAGGALCVAAAFSSKYHGAMSFLPVLIGHVMYCRRAGGIATARAFQRWAFLGVTGVVGIFLTSPALIINFDVAFGHIVHFFHYTADFGLTPELKALPFYGRLWMSWKENIPVIIYSISLPIFLGFLWAIIIARKDLRIGMLISVPLFHLFVGLAGKPNLHQSHHLPAIAYFLLAGVVASVFMLNSSRRNGITRFVVGIAMLWSVIHLSLATYRELFFFNRNDTRRVAETWIKDSVPPGVEWVTSTYTFKPPSVAENKLPAYVVAQSGNDVSVIPGMEQWAVFSHDNRQLSRFINLDIHIHLVGGHIATAGMSLPYMSPLPDDRLDSMVSLDVPWYSRTTRARDADESHPVHVNAVTTQKLDKAWVTIQTANSPVSMRLSFGKQNRIINMKAGEISVVEFDQPDHLIFPPGRRLFYPWSAKVNWGAARVVLHTDPQYIAQWAFQQGKMDMARLYLSAARKHNVTSRIIKHILNPADADEKADLRAALGNAVSSENEWFGLFGATQAWMDNIPYVQWSDEDWTRVSPSDESSHTNAFYSPLLWLSPGHYMLNLSGTDTNPALYEIYDSRKKLMTSGRIHREQPIPFAISGQSYPVVVKFNGIESPPDRVNIYPDAHAHLLDLLNLISKTEGAALSVAEMVAQPGEPLAEFDEGIVLNHAKIEDSNFHADGKIAIQLDWSLPHKIKRPGRLSAWIHVVDQDGHTVTQVDNPLWDMVSRINTGTLATSDHDVISFPSESQPGQYEIRVGVWIPDQQTRLAVRKAAVQHEKRYVVLKKLNISNPVP